MAILKALSVLPASPPSKSSILSLFTLGFVMSLSTGLANVSLKYNRLDMLCVPICFNNVFLFVIIH